MHHPRLKKKLVLGVLGSGSGTNLEAISDAIECGRLPNIRIGCVISDVAGAFILERARMKNIPARFVDAAPFRTKLEGGPERQVIDMMREHKVEAIALAGFMRMVKPVLLNAFPRRILNIHPSLLPAFPGMEAWRQALEYGARITGCTVHFVDAGMDTGPIILQHAVRVLDGDTPERLHKRIQSREHRAYPEALALLAAGRLAVEGRRVRILRGD